MRRLNARLGLLVLIVAVAVLGSSALASAQTYTVTNLSNSGVSGDGSLRGEVAAANTNPGADTVIFAAGLSGTISFTGIGIVIEGPIDIEGPGPGLITVSQTALHRVFELEANGGGAVSISGLHIAGGTAPAGGANPEDGGDIFNAGSNLMLVEDLITGGKARVGGGVDSDDGPLTLRDSTLEGNEAQFDGGLAAGDSGAPWAILSSTVRGNTAGVGGGLGLEDASTGLIEGSTISGNRAEVGAGAELEASGGGQLTIRSSTIAANVGGVATGLAIEAGISASVEIDDSTIAANVASEEDAGISWNSDAPLRILDSIVAANQAPGSGRDVYTETGTISSSFSLLGNVEAFHQTELSAGSDLLGVDPGLSPLAANGGPTETMALTPTSPAVNKGASTLATDQRGLIRPVAYPGIADSAAPGGNGADIGAFELQAPPSPAPAGAPPAKASPAPPSNHFKLGRLVLNRKNGTATIALAVPGPGVAAVAASKQVKGVRKTARLAGTVKLLVKAKGKALRSLGRSGSVKVKALISFTPSGGTAATVMKSVRLVERPGPAH